MNDYSLVRLFDTSEKYIVDHICSLSEEDKYLRFGFTPNKNIIEQYVKKTLSNVNTRTNADFWFAIKLNNEIKATIHIAIKNDVAEFALTTDKEHRGKKLGQLLFARGYQLVTEYSIDKIYLTCLSNNMAMRKIANKFGLVSVSEGRDIDSLKKIQYPISINQVNEFKTMVRMQN